jgi:hypothetical protein
MNGHGDSLRALVLRMLGTAHQPGPEELFHLEDSDWATIQRMTRQHRLGPLLLERDKALGQVWPIPAAIRQSWQDDFRKAAFAALHMERALHGIASTLAAKAIEVTALKGAWVAWHAYPYPALRPMRDLDILVPEDQALAARDALLSNGYEPMDRYTEPPEEALLRRKHLPGILASDSGVMVEVHSRLTDISGLPDQDAAADADRDEQLRHRMTGNVGGHSIFYLSPTDTLLHLIVHSAYDHRMNNGPAIFNDIAYIIKGHSIDWPRFWQRALKQQWMPGAELLLLLAERQFGDLPITWSMSGRPDIPEDILAATVLLSLQDHKQRAVVSAMGKATLAADGRSSRTRFWRRLRAPRHQLAPLLGVKNENPMAYAAYPLWLFRAGLKAYKGLSQRTTRDDTAKYATLSRWLGI